MVELIIEASHQTKDYLFVDIHTQHTSLCSINAIFICVIVLDEICFHMLKLCCFKHKNIFEYFRCFWKVFWLKNLKISKIQFCPVLAAQSRVCQVAGLSRIFAGHFWRLVREQKVQSRVHSEIFAAQLATHSRVDLPVAKNTQKNFSKFWSGVFWRLELATVWRLNPVAKIACLAETGAVFKPFPVFPRTFVTVHLLFKLFSSQTLRESCFPNPIGASFLISNHQEKVWVLPYQSLFPFSCIFLLLFGLILHLVYLPLCEMGLECSACYC